MEFFPAANKQRAKPELATLLLPALSIGNVGQLAVDLIISSWQVCKVGYLDHPCVLPCIGNDPFESINKGELAVALEVYEGDDDNLRIVQQRAPVIKGTMLQFSKSLCFWASHSDIKEVIILSGLDSGKRPMRDSESSPIRYISTANPDGKDQRCEALGWRQLEEYAPLSEPWKLLESQSLDGDAGVDDPDLQMSDDMYYPSLPFASLFSCCKARDLNAVCILFFCSEGDNIQDAFCLAEAVQKLVSANSSTGSRPQRWVVPESWRSVYGPPPDPSMFC